MGGSTTQLALPNLSGCHCSDERHLKLALARSLAVISMVRHFALHEKRQRNTALASVGPMCRGSRPLRSNLVDALEADENWSCW